MMACPVPRALRIASWLLLAGGGASTVALGAFEGLKVDFALAAVLGLAILAALPGLVLDDERTTFSLSHLPILAAALLLSPLMAPLLAGTLAAIDHRRYNRWTLVGNAGALALSAAAAACVFRYAAPAAGLPTDAADPLWFFAAAAAAAAFFLVNHSIVSLMIATRHSGQPGRIWIAHLRPMVGGDLTGSTILIGFVGLMAGVSGAALRTVVGAVALLSIGMLLALILRTREREEALAGRERALAEREEALIGREHALTEADLAGRRAREAVTRLHEVASGTVPVLVGMIDLKDRYTARHSASVARLCRFLAEELGWSPEDQALAHMAGLVHDIGKIGLPDELLRRRGRPTDEEWVLIRRHPDWGADALAELSIFGVVVDAVRTHHERWDGSGYPAGLAGDEIPALGRLVAIGDSYEAMTTRRPFKDAMSTAAAREELLAEGGRSYDARMVEAFVAGLERRDPPDHDGLNDFAAEWRGACVGLDIERLYVLVNGDAELTALRAEATASALAREDVLTP